MIDIAELRETFNGEVVLPDDTAYERLRQTLFSGGGAPAVLLRPRSTAAVAQAVAFARDNGLVLSVRSGGHSAAGFSTNVGGMVIDLVLMNGVEIIDEAQHTVRIGSGSHWGDVATELDKHGLAISSGDTKSVGVGGLTLGGGIGWMVRKYGLAIDSLVAAEVVTAAGEVLRASQTEHADLFWAIRGGGGNFGVVTQFEFVAHPTDQVYFGAITYGLENLAGLLNAWRDYMRTAPEALTSSITVMPPFPGKPAAALLRLCYDSADAAAVNAIVETCKSFGQVIKFDLQKHRYPDVLEEASPPPGMKVIVKNLLAKVFSDELIGSITAAAGPGRVIQIRGLGGAMARVPADATAFAWRDAEIMLFMANFVPPTASQADIDQALQPWRTLAPFGDGAYQNFISTNTPEDIAAIYPESTRTRLQQIKQIYDPGNLFNQNYNISPTAG